MDFYVYSEGPMACSVCSALPVEELVERLNAERPSGTTGGWQLDPSPTFKGGEPNPCPCDRDPETRKHYLFMC
jgi:hypothetical protein